jgi:hypothetical protein
MHKNKINYNNSNINKSLLIYKKKKLVMKLIFRINYQIYKIKNIQMKKIYCLKLNS